MDALLNRARKIAGRWPDWQDATVLVGSRMLGTIEVLDDEVALAVIDQPGEHPLEVSLYPDDDEWDCECGREPICVHVIAGLMGFTSGDDLGDRAALLDRYPPRPRRIEVVVPDLAPKETAKKAAASRSFPERRRKPKNAVVPSRTVVKRRSAAPLRYELTRSSYGLRVRRIITYSDEELDLQRELEGGESDAQGTHPVLSSDADLLIQEALGDGRESGVVGREKASGLLQALALAQDVKLDGRSVSPEDQELAKMVAFVENFGQDRVRIQIRATPKVDDTYINGFARRGDTVGRLIIDSALNGEEFQRLTLGQAFEVKQLPHVVTDVLPALRKRIPVEVVTDRLPDVVLSETRAVCWVSSESADVLHAEAFVVYGDPIIAKVVRNRLVPEGKTVPIREPDEEVPMATAIRGGLGLVPGKAETFTGGAARAFAHRLDAWEDGDVVGDAWEAWLDD